MSGAFVKSCVAFGWLSGSIEADINLSGKRGAKGAATQHDTL
jgi:hypothetical protein